MKLIVSGATGFLATEVVRQGLGRPEVTSLVVLSRKPIPPPGVDANSAAKLKQVLIKDYAEYSDDVKKEFADAAACIWTVAVTPTKSKAYKAEDLRRICYTSTIAGLTAMHEAGPARPFRFLYTSGFGVDHNTEPTGMYASYGKLRGECELGVLDFAKQHPGQVEAAIVRPGLITSTATVFRTVWGSAMRWSGLGTSIPREELAAAMLDQALHGFEKDTLSNDDLVRIGSKALEKNAE